MDLIHLHGGPVVKAGTRTRALPTARAAGQGFLRKCQPPSPFPQGFPPFRS